MRVLKVISEHLGVHLNINTNVTTPNIFIGDKHLLEDATFHYIYPHLVYEYTWFVPLAEPYPRWSSISRLYRTEAWLFGVLSLTLAAVALRCLAVQESGAYSSATNCLLNAWSVLTAVAVPRMPHGHSLRILFFSWVVYSLAIDTIFQAFVTTYLIDPGRQHQINNYQELIRNNFSFLFDSTRMAQRHLVLGNTPGFVFTSSSDTLIFALQRPHTALMLSDKIFTYHYQRVCDFNRSVYFHKLTHETVSAYLVLRVNKTFPYMSRVSDVISHMVQAGIPDRTMKTITDPKGLNPGTIRAIKNLNEEYVVLSPTHFLSAFTILLMGLGVSVVTFVTELSMSQTALHKFTVNLVCSGNSVFEISTFHDH